MRKLLVALTLLSVSLSTAAFAQAGRGTDAGTEGLHARCAEVLPSGHRPGRFHHPGLPQQNRAKISQACDQVLKNHSQ